MIYRPFCQKIARSGIENPISQILFCCVSPDFTFDIVAIIRRYRKRSACGRCIGNRLCGNIIKYYIFDIMSNQLRESNKVHLDHLIQRLSIRYSNGNFHSDNTNSPNRIHDPYIRYNDVRGEWFERLRKPDFQRETNSWSPIQCMEFVRSVFLGQIIPSIILWVSEENGTTYILDGAHRLSVLRAWMTDDWGDKSLEYYYRRDTVEIKAIATDVRDLINTAIGSFKEFKKSFDELQRLTDDGQAPKIVMTDKAYKQASFYAQVINSNSSLFAQWETGDYDSAEQSFLRINRQGQPLDPWEANLIEFRRGSYSRSIMHIANRGESGHFWPTRELTAGQKTEVESFSTLSKDIYDKLFVPPFQLPVRDLSVPILVAPAYFQKHLYLLELIPLLVWNKIAPDYEDQVELLKYDYQSDPNEVINNADKILKTMDAKLEHIITFDNNAVSLSLVPLLYWYNHRGQHLRGLVYGFMYWLMAGSEKDVRERKLIFTIHRERIEYILFEFKQDIAAFIRGIGAGLKGTKGIAQFFDELLYFLNSNRDLAMESAEMTAKVLALTKQTSRGSKSIVRPGRTFTNRDASQSNINELFKSSIRCHICGGIVNLNYGGIQYDHVLHFRTVGSTDPENIKPTHPFCNNNRDRIEKYRAEVIEFRPVLSDSHTLPVVSATGQLSFWGSEDEFPG